MYALKVGHTLILSTSVPPSVPPSFLPSLCPSLPCFLPLQVYESGLLSSSLLAEVYAPIPDPQLTSATPTVVAGYQFSCSKTAGYTHTAVGSGGWNTILCVQSQFHSSVWGMRFCVVWYMYAVVQSSLYFDPPSSPSLLPPPFPCPSLSPSLLLLLAGESHPSLPDAGIVGEDGRVLCPPKFRQPVSFQYAMLCISQFTAH